MDSLTFYEEFKKLFDKTYGQVTSDVLDKIREELFAEDLMALEDEKSDLEMEVSELKDEMTVIKEERDKQIDELKDEVSELEKNNKTDLKCELEMKELRIKTLEDRCDSLIGEIGVVAHANNELRDELKKPPTKDVLENDLKWCISIIRELLSITEYKGKSIVARLENIEEVVK